MSRLYEAMFLIDNDTVRASWQQAKAAVTALIEKHGGSVCTARRWGERRLAYPIKRRNRATFLLSYLELPAETIPALHRDIEINEMILRHLILRAEAVPAEEVELTKAETTDEFVVPEPPADDVVDEPVSRYDRDDSGDDDIDIPNLDDDGDGPLRPPIRREAPARAATAAVGASDNKPEATEG